MSDERLLALDANGLLADAARSALEAAREAIRRGAHAPLRDDLVDDVRRRMEDATRPPLRRLINATGVILHTNLGRAPLPAAEPTEEEKAAAFKQLVGDLKLIKKALARP